MEFTNVFGEFIILQVKKGVGRKGKNCRLEDTHILRSERFSRAKASLVNY